MLIVLSGAKLNAGDYLITDRAKKLLEKSGKGEELVQLPGHLPLNDHMQLLGRARALVILGGPGCRPNIYPRVYPLLASLDSIPIPIILLGTGWKGIGSHPTILESYRFERMSETFLRRCASAPSGIGVRDMYTYSVLKRTGIDRVRITGCPAWYSEEYIGAPFNPPREIRRIAVSAPFSVLVREQFVQLVERLRGLFPTSELAIVFHQGFEYRGDSGTPEMFAFQREMRDQFEAQSIVCIDISQSPDMSVYDTCDLHLGYRVHAHIYRLSARKLSFLVSEDGRGEGVDDTLRIPKFLAFLPKESWLGGRTPLSLIPKPARAPNYELNRSLTDEITQALLKEMEHGFPSFHGFPAIIDHYYGQMRSFLSDLFHCDCGHGS